MTHTLIRVCKKRNKSFNSRPNYVIWYIFDEPKWPNICKTRIKNKIIYIFKRKSNHFSHVVIKKKKSLKISINFLWIFSKGAKTKKRKKPTRKCQQQPVPIIFFFIFHTSYRISLLQSKRPSKLLPLMPDFGSKYSMLFITSMTLFYYLLFIFCFCKFRKNSISMGVWRVQERQRNMSSSNKKGH